METNKLIELRQNRTENGMKMKPKQNKDVTHEGLQEISSCFMLYPNMVGAPYEFDLKKEKMFIKKEKNIFFLNTIFRTCIMTVLSCHYFNNHMSTTKDIFECLIQLSQKLFNYLVCPGEQSKK